MEPTPTGDLTPEDGGSSVLVTALVAISGAIAGWFAVRGIRRLQNAAPASEPLDPARVVSPPIPMTPSSQLPPSSASAGTATPHTTEAGLFDHSPGAPMPVGGEHSTVWSRPTKYLAGIGLVVFGLLCLFLMRSILPILVTAGLIALIVQPLIGWFRAKLHLSPRLAMAMSYLVILFLVAAIPLIVIPTTWNVVNGLQAVDTAPIYEELAAVLNSAENAVSTLPIIGPAVGQSFEPLRTMLESAAAGDPVNILPADSGTDSSRMALATIGRVTGLLTPLISWVLAAAFALLISLYLSSGHYSLRTFVLDKMPAPYVPEIAILLDRIAWTWGSFLQGQLKLMFFIGVVVFLGNAILGNRYAAMLGLISGVLEIIPTIGPALALIPGVLMALIFGSSWLGVSNLLFAVIVLAFYLLVQVVENQYVVPRVLGDAVELPPLIVLVGVLVGGSLGGILGALIAVPVIASMREIVGYLYGKIIEAPPLEARPGLELGLLETLTATARNLRTRLFGSGS